MLFGITATAGNYTRSRTRTKMNHNFCVANFGAAVSARHCACKRPFLVSCPLLKRRNVLLRCFFALAVAVVFRLAPYNLARPAQFYFVQHIQLAHWSLLNVSNCACPMLAAVIYHFHVYAYGGKSRATCNGLPRECSQIGELNRQRCSIIL